MKFKLAEENEEKILEKNNTNIKKYYDIYGNPATEGHWEGDLYFPIYDEEGNEYVPKELWED